MPERAAAARRDLATIKALPPTEAAGLLRARAEQEQPRREAVGRTLGDGPTTPDRGLGLYGCSKGEQPDPSVTDRLNTGDWTRSVPPLVHSDSWRPSDRSLVRRNRVSMRPSSAVGERSPAGT